MKKITLICCLLLISGCASSRQFIDLEEGVRYSMVKEKQKLMSFTSPLGTWNQLRYIDQPKDEIARSLIILNGRSPFAWVGYEARLGVQSVEPFAGEKSRLSDALTSGDMVASVNRRISEFYTEKLRKDVGITEVKGSLTELGGYACTQIDETQSYGPEASDPKWGDNHLAKYITYISCPMIIDGELWELHASYTATIATNRFNRHYGDNAPGIDEIQKDFRARLQPMYDSIIVYRKPSQRFPDSIGLNN